MTGNFKINNSDAYTAYGCVLADGAFDELWKLPVPKPGYVHDWPDQHGMETDPDAEPRFARLEYSVPILMVAPNTSQYWSKYNALFSFLLSAKEFNLDVPERSRRFKVRYAGASGLQELLEYTDGNVGSTFLLNLTNDYPNQIFSIP